MRQRRHQRVGGVLVAALVLGALIAGIGGGGGGLDRHSGGGASRSNPGAGSPHLTANTSFPGAPSTQHVYGVSSDMCPLAPRNRYLPPRSGCVGVRRADIDGDGRRDLIIVYSRLGSQRLPPYAGEPPSMRHDYEAKAAFLKVVLNDGTSITARITGVDGARVAAVDAVAHVSADPGGEIFLEVARVSSGATGVAYGFQGGKLVPAGVYLSYNGDSGVQAGFDCVSGNPPRLIQRYFAFIGPNEFTRSWREQEVVFAWHGPTLVQLSVHSFKGLVALKSSETHIGQGCIRGVS